MWFIWCVTPHRGTNRKWNLEFNKTPFLPFKLLDIYKRALQENLYRHGKNFYWAEFTRLYTCFMQNIGTLPYSYFAWEGKIGRIFVQCVNYLTWNRPYMPYISTTYISTLLPCPALNPTQQFDIDVTKHIITNSSYQIL